MEGHDVGLHRFEDFAKRVHEGFLGWVVGPEAENASGFDLLGELLESPRGVEPGVVLGEEVGGGVIDIEEDGVELLNVGVVSFAEGEFEEIAEDVFAARIVVEAFAEGDEFLLVSFDDGLEVVHDAEGAHFREFQGGPGGVSQS